MDIKNIFSPPSETGLLWSQLSEKQKQSVIEFFGDRQPVGSELTNTYYHFSKDGVCLYAD